MPFIRKHLNGTQLKKKGKNLLRKNLWNIIYRTILIQSIQTYCFSYWVFPRDSIKINNENGIKISVVRVDSLIKLFLHFKIKDHRKNNWIEKIIICFLKKISKNRPFFNQQSTKMEQSPHP